MIRSRQDAADCGPLVLAAWDREMGGARTGEVLDEQFARLQDIERRRKSERPRDGMTKLERAFWERARERFRDGAYREPIKLRLAGRCFYCPDFLIDTGFDIPTFYETKGPRVWEDSIIKLKTAAERYGSLFGFVLVTRPKRNRWECRHVTSSGIGRDVWRPSWLD